MPEKASQSSVLIMKDIININKWSIISELPSSCFTDLNHLKESSAETESLIISDSLSD